MKHNNTKYVKYLRSAFRLPIELSAKVSGSKITKKYINNTLKQKPQHKKDRIFLMYDVDVEGMLEKLQKIDDSTFLASNPCFEIWYIFHYCNQIAHISTNQCLDRMIQLCHDYSEGVLSLKLKEKVLNLDVACERAKARPLYNNPSSSIYVLIEELLRAIKFAE